MLSKKEKKYKLKKLAIMARENINSKLSLKQTKSIKYNEYHYFTLLLLISVFTCFTQGGGDLVNDYGTLPKGDSLLDQLHKLKKEEIIEQFMKLFESQFKSIFKFSKKKPKVVLALDETDKPTYSKYKKTNDNIVGGKKKSSTHYFFRFATISIANNKNPLTLHVIHCDKNTTKVQVVEELVNRAKKLVRIKVLLIDRGFYSTDVFNKLDEMNVKYLMPSKKDNKTGAMFNRYLKSNFEIKLFYCQNKKKEYADFRLVMIRLKNKKEMGYVTNIYNITYKNASSYIKLYQKRWNIETGYRLQNMFLAKTCSTNSKIRYYYFCYAVALHNLWIIINNNMKNIDFNISLKKLIFAILTDIVVNYLNIADYKDSK